MRIGFRWPAVSGPASVTDAHGSRDGLATQHGFEIAQFAFTAANLHMAAVQNPKTSRIVTAIFEFSQALENKGRCFACADIADDAAHLFFVSFHLFPFLFSPAFAQLLLTRIEHHRAGGNVVPHRASSGDVNV